MPSAPTWFPWNSSPLPLENAVESVFGITQMAFSFIVSEPLLLIPFAMSLAAGAFSLVRRAKRVAR